MITRLPLTSDPTCAASSSGTVVREWLDELIEQQPRLPPALPWAEIHERVRFVVETMEDIEGERPSSPQLFDGHAKPE